MHNKRATNSRESSCTNNSRRMHAFDNNRSMVAGPIYRRTAVRKKHPDEGAARKKTVT